MCRPVGVGGGFGWAMSEADRTAVRSGSTVGFPITTGGFSMCPFTIIGWLVGLLALIFGGTPTP